MQSGSCVLKRGVWLLLLNCFLALGLHAAFSKGYRDFTLNDPQRQNREIPVRIWYPAESEGMNASVSEGKFPVVAFGHGWGMSTELYQPIVDRLVPVGYILIMVNTETMIFIPDHAALGKDLAFSLQWLRQQDTQSGSAFEGRAGEKFALMGHSMGGGASVLSGNNPDLVNLLVLLAPADTNPSSVAAAPAVNVPTLLFSGSGDGVTTPAAMHQPIFNALGTTCKYFINIKGGNHCYFALDDPTGCDLLESFAGSQTLLEREQQQDILFDLLVPAMDYFLKSNEDSWGIFLDSLSSGKRTEIKGSCDPASTESPSLSDGLSIFPQPADQWLRIRTKQAIKQVMLFDMAGKKCNITSQQEYEGMLVYFENLQSGIYVLEISGSDRQIIRQKISVAY